MNTEIRDKDNLNATAATSAPGPVQDVPSTSDNDAFQAAYDFWPHKKAEQVIEELLAQPPEPQTLDTTAHETRARNERKIQAVGDMVFSDFKPKHEEPQPLWVELQKDIRGGGVPQVVERPFGPELPFNVEKMRNRHSTESLVREIWQKIAAMVIEVPAQSDRVRTFKVISNQDVDILTGQINELFKDHSQEYVAYIWQSLEDIIANPAAFPATIRPHLFFDSRKKRRALEVVLRTIKRASVKKYQPLPKRGNLEKEQAENKPAESIQQLAEAVESLKVYMVDLIMHSHQFSGRTMADPTFFKHVFEEFLAGMAHFRQEFLALTGAHLSKAVIETVFKVFESELDILPYGPENRKLSILTRSEVRTVVRGFRTLFAQMNDQDWTEFCWQVQTNIPTLLSLKSYKKDAIAEKEAQHVSQLGKEESVFQKMDKMVERRPAWKRTPTRYAISMATLMLGLSLVYMGGVIAGARLSIEDAMRAVNARAAQERGGGVGQNNTDDENDNENDLPALGPLVTLTPTTTPTQVPTEQATATSTPAELRLVMPAEFTNPIVWNPRTDGDYLNYLGSLENPLGRTLSNEEKMYVWIYVSQVYNLSNDRFNSSEALEIPQIVYQGSDLMVKFGFPEDNSLNPSSTQYELGTEFRKIRYPGKDKTPDGTRMQQWQRFVEINLSNPNSEVGAILAKALAIPQRAITEPNRVGPMIEWGEYFKVSDAFFESISQ